MQSLKPPLSVYVYALSDFVLSLLAWVALSLIRINLLFGDAASSGSLLNDDWFIVKSVFIIPGFWICFYALLGSYKESLYEKDRMKELISTFIVSMIGTVVLFFIVFLNDVNNNFTYFYKIFFCYWLLQSLLIFGGRFMLLSLVKRQLIRGIYCFKTLFIGNNERARNMYLEIDGYFREFGYKTIGYCSAESFSQNGLSHFIPRLGDLTALDQLIQQYQVKQVIVALDKSELKSIPQILKAMNEQEVAVKIVADNYDIISGSVKTANVVGASLIDISKSVMPPWQENLKRIIDFIVAAVGLIILSPLMLLVAIKTKASSFGPVIYSQQRIGYKGRPFMIYKFRSMFADAEKNGPDLSSDHDKRITSWGKFMRKWRLDELPQLWNILKGDMSLVGPRPERKFYIDQISEHHPYYSYLLRVKPGLTSWGMIRYGYASSVEEMMQRLKFDLLYVENASLLLDIKILMRTLKIIVRGKGK